MSAIRTRLARLEAQGTGEETVLVIIGEPDARQRAILDAGTARMVIQIPDNGRGRDDQAPEQG
ncbi:hypothetical protein [Thiorhodococcus minor]|uniref:Uncharacterized protein n=1 Tax=Thiorhodococcus minor TaxID=57489 RepID=A0A6M0JVX0_9GAMM|nr:hypothetical protein [Thiorhodococcus minor]NEV61660.1 hypothetical protein [Thiorhodococcus minor]